MEGGLSSARSNSHSVPPPSEFPLHLSASSILQTTNAPLGPLPSPDPVPPTCTITEAPAPSTSWDQTLKMLVAQSSAISLSAPPSPSATKRPSATLSNATAKRAVPFEDQQNDAVSQSQCVSPTTCAHNSCSSVVAMTATRRRYQRRNSKTPAMLMQSMSTGHASQALPSQSSLTSGFALNGFSIRPDTIISSGNEVKPTCIAGSTTVGAPNRSTSSAGTNIGSVLPEMNECCSRSTSASNNTMSDCEMQRIKSMPPRIVSEDFGIGMEREQSPRECCKRRKLV